MSTASTLPSENAVVDSYEPYRALSKGAILSLILAAVSLAALSAAFLAVIPLLGLFIGWNSYLNIRRYPGELSGKIPAILGTVLCGLLFVTSVGWHSFTYATEVPEGYQRIAFSDLQPDPEEPRLPISPKSLELNGKKVFIKGYVYPDGQQSNIKQFVLVPDMGTCCFGGQPKLTDMIQVTLEGSQRIKYSLKKRKLAGELVVDTSLKPISGLGGVYFELKADHVQ